MGVATDTDSPQRGSQVGGNKKYSWRYLPIHEACYCEGSIELFEFFHDLYPAGLYERGRYDFTPLRYACVLDGDSMDHVLPAFLQHIVAKAPELIRARDTNG